MLKQNDWHGNAVGAKKNKNKKNCSLWNSITKLFLEIPDKKGRSTDLCAIKAVNRFPISSRFNLWKVKHSDESWTKFLWVCWEQTARARRFCRIPISGSRMKNSGSCNFGDFFFFFCGKELVFAILFFSFIKQKKILTKETNFFRGVFLVAPFYPTEARHAGTKSEIFESRALTSDMEQIVNSARKNWGPWNKIRKRTRVFSLNLEPELDLFSPLHQSTFAIYRRARLPLDWPRYIFIKVVWCSSQLKSKTNQLTAIFVAGSTYLYVNEVQPSDHTKYLILQMAHQDSVIALTSNAKNWAREEGRGGAQHSFFFFAAGLPSFEWMIYRDFVAFAKERQVSGALLLLWDIYIFLLPKLGHTQTRLSWWHHSKICIIRPADAWPVVEKKKALFVTRLLHTRKRRYVSNFTLCAKVQGKIHCVPKYKGRNI